MAAAARVNNLSQNRDLTDVEVALVRHIGMDIANSLVDPWTRVAELTPEISELAVGPQVVHVVPPSEFVITAWYEVKVAEHTGSVSVCFPLTILEQVIPNLSGQTLFDTRARSGEGADQVIRQDQLHPVKILLRAMLGDTTIGASELAGIQEGDVLLLDTRVDDPLRLIVGNVERFAGYPGTRGKKLAVQVSGLIDDDGFPVPFQEDGPA
ncbi:MAG: FliM/FliN family flagellar motor switch protein [Dehalococcoidia bacterium]|nr:FliM/FliN family flagellar motor switch protein [Dehalococcoidia bacterium]